MSPTHEDASETEKQQIADTAAHITEMLLKLPNPDHALNASALAVARTIVAAGQISPIQARRTIDRYADIVFGCWRKDNAELHGEVDGQASDREIIHDASQRALEIFDGIANKTIVPAAVAWTLARLLRPAKSRKVMKDILANISKNALAFWEIEKSAPPTKN